MLTELRPKKTTSQTPRRTTWPGGCHRGRGVAARPSSTTQVSIGAGAGGAAQGAGAGGDDQRDRQQLDRRQVLTEGDEADQRRDRRLETHQHPEDALRQASQRLQLERVGDHRAEQADADAGRQQCRRNRSPPPRRRRTGRAAPPRSPSRSPVRPRRGRPADPHTEDDVGGPEGAGGEPECGPGGVDRIAAEAAREQHDAKRRQSGPQQVERPPRAGEGDRERPGELEGDRDSERQPVERLVEAEVHPRQRDAEQCRQPQALARDATDPRPPDRREDQRRGSRAQEHCPTGPRSSNSVVARAPPPWTEKTRSENQRDGEGFGRRDMGS